MKLDNSQNSGGGSFDPAAVAITGGTITGLTGLAIRSSGAAFNLTFASSEALTAGRTLSFNVGDANRTLTIPATGTAALLGTANVFTANQTINGTTNLPLVVSNTTAACYQQFKYGAGLSGGYVGTSGPGMTFLNAAGSAFTLSVSDSGAATVPTSGSIGFSDVGWFRDAANIMALKLSSSAQTLRVYGTTTGSKYAQLTHDGTNAVLSASSGNVHITNLPTSNPGPGILWNNAGTPAIGT
jgi:hypothetical protein